MKGEERDRERSKSKLRIENLDKKEIKFFSL